MINDDVMIRYSVYLVLLLVVPFTACDSVLNIDIVGDGNRIKVDREVSAFSEIYLDSEFELTITSGEPQRVEVVCDSNLLSYVITEVQDNRLNVRHMAGFDLMPRQPVRVKVVVTSLSVLELLGGGEAIADKMNVEDLKILVLGVSSFRGKDVKCNLIDLLAEGSTLISLDGDFRKLSLKQKGSGEVKLSGTGRSCELTLEGSGKVDATAFTVPFSTVRLFGSGLVFSYASEVLNVFINGNGRVYYYGEPLTINSDVKGDGLVLPGE